MNPYKNALQNLFLVIDSAHASNNQLFFRYSLFRCYGKIEKLNVLQVKKCYLLLKVGR